MFMLGKIVSNLVKFNLFRLKIIGSVSVYHNLDNEYFYSKISQPEIIYFISHHFTSSVFSEKETDLGI